MIKPAFPVLSKILVTEDDVEALADACWAISYLSDGENERIQAIIDNFEMETFVKLVQHENKKICTPALR
jgi:5,10-methenyltetrahydromethanopterin hydrogenase